MFINTLTLPHLKISEFQPQEKPNIENVPSTENSQSANPLGDDFFNSAIEIVDPALISKKKVSFGSSISHEIKNLFDKIKNLFVLNIIIGPKLNKFISKQLKEIKPENYKDNYPTLLDSAHQFMKELKEKFNTTPPSFEDKRDLHHFQLKLVNRVNKILNKHKIPSISKEEFKAYSIDFKFRTRTKEKLTDSELSKLLMSIEPQEMPISLLSEIEFNSENESVLVDAWKKITENLVTIGSLNKLNIHKLRKEAPLRITCAVKLLEVIQYAPRSKNFELDQLLETYSNSNFKSNLEDFIVHENSLLTTPIKLNNLSLLSKQEEYEAHVKPHIKELIQKLRLEYEASNLIKALLDQEECKKIQNAIFKGKTLSFSFKSVENMLIKELEIFATRIFKLTDTQLKNLKHQRENLWKERESGIKGTLQRIREYFSFKPPVENALIFGEDVAEKIRKKGFVHSSKIPDEALIALLNLTSLRAKEASKLSEDDTLEFIDSLQTLSTIPNILEILKKFEKSKVNLKGAIGKNEVSLQKKLGILHTIYRKVHPYKANGCLRLPAGITTDTRSMVATYFQAKGMSPELEELIPKAQALLEKYKDDPTKISKSEKLNLEEIGKLFEFTEFKSELDVYKKLGIESHPMIRNLVKVCDEVIQIKDAFETLLFPLMEKHYDSGDIFVYKGDSKAQWRGRDALSHLDELANKFCGGYTHGMKAYHNQRGELITSEISGSYSQPKMRIYDIAISDIFRLDLNKLIPQSSAAKLKELLGDNWKEEIHKKYIKIEKQIHGIQSTKYSGIHNCSERRAYAGMSNWKRFFSLIKPLTNLDIPGHKLAHEQDFREIYHTFMDGKQINEKQICSEFTAKSTLVAIMELNKVMSRFAMQKNPELQASNIHKMLTENDVKISKNVEDYLKGERYFGVKKGVTKKAEKDLIQLLRKQGFSKNKIKLTIRLNNEELIDLPFDKKERLETIHPARLVDLLKEKNYVTQVPQLKELQALINL